MHNLQRYPELKTQNYSVKGQCSVVDERLVVDFEVSTKTQWHTSEEFSTATYENWGLWNFDVVEVFVTGHHGHLPYLEIQISPLGQTFALVIDEPRKIFAYPKDLKFNSSSKVEGNTWTAHLDVSLKSIPGMVGMAKGNLHACLGLAPEREYFGLHISDRIDFHRPEFFQELGVVHER